MRSLLLLITIGALCTLGRASASAPDSPAANHGPSRFTYTRLYCGADHESHFAEATVDLTRTDVAPPAPPIYIGGELPASGALFAGFDAHWGASDLKNHLYHPAPAVELLSIVSGEFSVTATDGQTRKFRAGDVLRVEDTAPCKGHITVVGDQPAFLVAAR